MGHRVAIVGRSRQADIRLTDRSVSRLHAELVVAAEGTLHLTDRTSANGTWIKAGREWERVRQRTVRSGDCLRFGRVELTVSELLSRVPERAADEAGYRTNARRPAGSAAAGTPRAPGDDLPRGRVRRNPLTGEVIGD